MQNRGKTFWGLALIVLGVLWVLVNLDILPGDIGHYWPLILIFWGINLLVESSKEETEGKE